MLGRQRLIKVVSAIAVSVLSGGAAWGMTNVVTSHSSRVAATEVDSSTSSSVDETSSTESTTTTEATTTTDDSTTTTQETTTSVAAPTSTPATCNHGADVSRVAHEAPRGDGNEHGKAVSEAAHQKCEHAADSADSADAADHDEQGDAEQHDGKAKSHKPDDADVPEAGNGDSGQD
jgi:hypothetical protein